MDYQSTRGQQNGVSASQTIVQGLARDGGLFVPETLPVLTEEDWALLQNSSYPDQARLVFKKFMDFTDEEIDYCVDGAYNTRNFDIPAIAPLAKITDKLSIQELWHGPTCAFKDMALQILPYLLTTSAKKNGETNEIVILVATSGDTGKAALEGFKDVPGTRIVVFFPDEGVSLAQKRQMITQTGNNVMVAAIRGNFDDAQNAVKRIFSSPEIAERMEKRHMQLSSANSINWGRLLPQITYYVAACAAFKKEGKAEAGVNVVVPTGNFGNILAAYYAKQLGAPINKLICASNANKVLTDFIQTGTYDRNRNFEKTISPSMDILISSNLERLLYELTGHDGDRVAGWMKQLNESGQYTVDAETLTKIQDLFWAGFADDAMTVATIRDVWQQHHYLLDTHTAVAYTVYNAYEKETGDTRQTLIASTANPFKFSASVASAVMKPEEIGDVDEFTLLKKLSATTGNPIPTGLKDLDLRPVLHTTVADKEAIDKVLMDYLQA